MFQICFFPSWVEWSQTCTKAFRDLHLLWCLALMMYIPRSVPWLITQEREVFRVGRVIESGNNGLCCYRQYPAAPASVPGTQDTSCKYKLKPYRIPQMADSRHIFQWQIFMWVFSYTMLHDVVGDFLFPALDCFSICLIWLSFKAVFLWLCWA